MVSRMEERNFPADKLLPLYKQSQQVDASRFSRTWSSNSEKLVTKTKRAEATRLASR